MLHPLYISATSACFELDNTSPYCSSLPYSVSLDDGKTLQGNTNVFSLFDLIPNRAYTLVFRQGETNFSLSFRTESESCAVNVRDFGAVGDGITDDTRAIENAILFTPPDTRLFFPEGTYLSRPLALRSNLTLEFSKNATLLGSPDRHAYPILPGTVQNANGGTPLMIGAFEGLARPMYQSLLHAEYCRNITIIGEGTIDGNAQNSDFWTAHKSFPTARPRLMFFCNCENIAIHGICARNSPSWHLHPFYSRHVAFYDIRVQAPANSPNTDAIDPEACEDVQMIGCRLSVGDDCIAIKSGKIELCRMRKQSASDHVIRNCLMEFGHGAVTIGSETAGGVQNLIVSQCLFSHTDRGLRIKTRRGRGKDCDISGIVFDNIHMEGVITPFVINMWYNCCDPDRYSDYVKCRSPLPIDDRTPHLGSFAFQNITCTGAQAAACYIDGLPEAPIDRVTFSHVRISFAQNAQPFIPAMQNDAVPACRLGLYCNNVRHVVIDQVWVCGTQGDALLTPHCDKVEVFGLWEA